MAERCPYCGEEMDDSIPPKTLSDDGKLLWRHESMECEELGVMEFQLTEKGKARRGH